MEITLGDETVTEEVPTLAAGETTTVNAALTSLPQPGVETELTVFVEPVAGEADSENNTASYSVIFGTA